MLLRSHAYPRAMALVFIIVSATSRTLLLNPQPTTRNPQPALNITMVATTQPLEREQQLLLQRVMASHCLNHKDAQRVFDELRVQNDSLEDAFETINRQLTRGFGLEIATVVLDKTKYHSVINLRNDEVSGNAFELHYNSHERALVRLILEKFVAAAETDDDVTEAVGPIALPKKDLINLRNDLVEPYKLSTVAHAQHVVEMLLDEKFLRISEASTTPRRESMQTLVELAPRAYLELSTYLAELGVPQDSMPQFLFHRSSS
jgi:hypothetical protein